MGDYPNLEKPIDNKHLSGEFVFSDKLPPEHLVGNVYLIPRVGDRWLCILKENGDLDFPGGKPAPRETYQEALERELMEEAGVRYLSFRPIGYWRTTSKHSEPLEPHLPHPESYGLVGTGEVETLSEPTNPEGVGKTLEVRIDTLKSITTALEAQGRAMQAELYKLAANSPTENSPP